MPILSPDENMILIEKTKHKGASGDLFLTNKRILFEHVAGLISKRAYVTLDLPLEGVENVAIEGVVTKHLTIYAKKGFVGSFPAKLEFSVGDPTRWQTGTLHALNLRLGTMDRREKIEALVDFAALKDFMSKGGFFVQVVKCPNCGGPLKLPESGNQTTCVYCKSTVLAQDLVERIKGLL